MDYTWTDTQIIKALLTFQKEGVDQATEQLFIRFQQLLTHFILIKIKDKMEADSLVNKVIFDFVSKVQKDKNFKLEKGIFSFLRGMANMNIKNYFWKVKKQDEEIITPEEFSKSDKLFSINPIPFKDQEHITISKEFWDIFANELILVDERKLRIEHKTAYVLRHIYGYSYKEIAASLNLKNEEAARNLVRVMRHRLKKAFSENEDKYQMFCDFLYYFSRKG